MNILPQGLASLPQVLASLPQGLASLPNELIIIIFNFIQKITDKRQFLKTCVLYNKLTKQSIINAENNNATEYFNKFGYYINFNSKIVYDCALATFVLQYITKYCVEKFTLELCYDEYFDRIPLLYFKVKNTMLIKAFCAFNNIEMLEKAKHNSCKADINVCSHGAYSGHLDVVKWGKNNGYNINWTTCERAAYNGHLNILQWIDIPKNFLTFSDEFDFLADVQDPAINNNVCEYAALNGHLDIVMFVAKIGVNVDADALGAAASGGHFDVVCWLIEHGCPVDVNVCGRAAIAGQLDMLKYLRDLGYPWHKNTCKIVKYNEHMNVYNWMIENGCENAEI